MNLFREDWRKVTEPILGKEILGNNKIVHKDAVAAARIMKNIRVDRNDVAPGYSITSGVAKDFCISLNTAGKFIIFVPVNGGGTMKISAAAGKGNIILMNVIQQLHIFQLNRLSELIFTIYHTKRKIARMGQRLADIGIVFSRKFQ